MVDKKRESNKKLVSRRDFLTAGEAVIAAGALSALTPNTITETVTPAQTKTVAGAPATTTKTGFFFAMARPPDGRRSAC